MSWPSRPVRSQGLVGNLCWADIRGLISEWIVVEVPAKGVSLSTSRARMRVRVTDVEGLQRRLIGVGGGGGDGEHSGEAGSTTRLEPASGQPTVVGTTKRGEVVSEWENSAAVRTCRTLAKCLLIGVGSVDVNDSFVVVIDFVND